MEFQVHKSAPATPLRLGPRKPHIDAMWTPLMEGQSVSIDAPDRKAFTNRTSAEYRIYNTLRARARNAGIGRVLTTWKGQRRFFWLERAAVSA